ncbi:MAG: hypothetical protein RIQ56_532 [Candidatus Parcubacteria bacterium]|jgi:hypothetical protein
MTSRLTKGNPPPPPTQGSGQTTAPRIPTGQELYDTIMGEIEPDLTSSGIKTLAEKYKDEKPGETIMRKQRYELAMERYNQAYSDYIETLHAQVERYRRSSFNEIELKDRARESSILDQFPNAVAAA